MNDYTPSILCKNGPAHTHHSVIESKVCYGILPTSALQPYFGATVGPSVLSPAPRPTKMVTPSQLHYIEQLGGDKYKAASLTRKAASALIDQLKKQPRREVPMTQEAAPPDPRLAMIGGLLDTVRDGYYAVHEYEGGHVDFLRVSRPKKQKWAGSIKVQTVHGSPGDVRLSAHPVAAFWPSGTLSIYKDREGTTRALMLLIADSQGAARRYAKLLNNCCRCNATLTDDRSRHYGIGPECEKYWPHIIGIVDLEDELAASES